jgi:putative toxin-antitoxin system antitoxin component (TIGR02293 family)
MSTPITGENARKVLKKYEKSFENPISIYLSSKKGLKPEAVFDLFLLLHFTGSMVEEVLFKSLKTFSNYKKNNTPLDAAVSEKVLTLFSLYNKGISLFGSVEEFNNWIDLPAFGLGDQIPKHLLSTITGIRLVEDELTRIEYGDLA